VAGTMKGGNYLVEILATYTDDNGVAYNSTLPLELTIYAPASILSLKTAVIGLGIAIVAVAAYVVYTIRFKRPK